MQARETNLFKFLEGNKQFIIPIYQRTYSWEREQCEQLWHDITRAATRPEIKAHFVGSIVYIQQGLFQVAGLPQMLVIDGQQRLTTLTLLLTALAQTVNKGEVAATINSEQIYDFFLTNRYGNGDERYKLLLTQSDRETLKALVDDRDLPQHSSSRLKENFDYFAEQIRKSNLDPQTIYQGIAKVVVVDIALDRDHDNPQLIFESLNSTGMDLSQADLIRNYILMRLEPDQQQQLYQQQWYPMEQLFGNTNYATHFDRFMRDYLTIKTRTIPRIDAIYKVFKLYREESQTDISIAAITADIHRFAKYYVKLAFGGETDLDLQRALSDIKEIEVNVAFPFLMEAYDDYTQGILSKVDLLAFIRLVETYVVRRAICDVLTNSMNKTFASIMRDIDKTNYRHSVEAAFMALGSYKRLPRDDEFHNKLLMKDVYKFQRRNYFLRKLENNDRKERVIVEGLTIEHIMPQNQQLSAAWRQDLGPEWQSIQERYLHTIGNLTLTGYNSEMSDRSFQEKRDVPGGFKQSPLYLNEGLGQLDHWNEATIQARAEALAARALLIWNIPQGPEYSDMARRREEKNTLEHYAELTNPEMLDLFMSLRQRILNLDAEVQETYFKNGIAFGIPDQFVFIRPRQTQVGFELAARPDSIDDPENWCRYSTALSKSGRAWVKSFLKSPADLDYTLYIIEQSYLTARDGDDDTGSPASNGNGYAGSSNDDE